MIHLVDALNRPANAYRSQNKGVAWLLVAITILIVTVFEPLLRFLVEPQYQVNILQILKTTLYGIGSYVLLCSAMWLICKCFGSKTPLLSYIKTWGISFPPNIVCAMTVAITEVFFYIFWNSSLWGMFFSIVYVGVLIWKIVLYVIFLREVAKLQRAKFLGAFLVIAVLIAFLAAINGYVGLKTPIL